MASENLDHAKLSIIRYPEFSQEFEASRCYLPRF